MKGWVGLVGWPVADGLPTLVVNWSPISCRSSAGQGKFASQRPTFYHCATLPATSTTTSTTASHSCGILLPTSHVPWSVCLCECWVYRRTAQKRLKPIEMPGADSCGPKEPCVRWDGYWRQLANTTERSVSGRHAALRQIILTILHKTTLYPNIYLHIWHGWSYSLTD